MAEKVSKKAAKKAAKKAPHKEKEHEAGKHLRRAYEHMGRLEALQPSLPKTVLAQIAALTEFGRRSLNGGDAKSSADLLRACEHIAFAALAPNGKASVSDELRDAVTAQYEKLREKAVDHWDERAEEDTDAEIVAAYDRTFAAAETAYMKAAFRKALELMRATEALTHVHASATKALPDGEPKQKRLK